MPTILEGYSSGPQTIVQAGKSRRYSPHVYTGLESAFTTLLSFPAEPFILTLKVLIVAYSMPGKFFG